MTSSTSFSPPPPLGPLRPTVAEPLQLLQTCQTCFNAKIRCDRTQDLEVCDRCLRLNKECYFPPAKRRQNPAGRDAHILPLPKRGRPAGSEARLQNSTSKTAPGLTALANGPSSHPLSSGNTQNLRAKATICDPQVHGPLSARDVESALDTYRSSFMPQFPFVAISPSVTAQALRQRSPFLFLTVVTVASYTNAPIQRRLAKEVIESISANLICGGFSSIDMLQGLLVFLAWSQYHPRPRRYSQFLQLAISIITDLRLERHRNMQLELDEDKSSEDCNSSNLENMRAVLGCYYLSSSVSTVLQKMCTFPYIAYLDTCCVSLDRSREYPTDKYIAPIIQLQHLMEMADFSLHQQSSSVSLGALPGSYYADKLETFKTRLRFPLLECLLLNIQYHATELFICQCNFPDTVPGIGALNLNVPWSTQRLDALSNGLVAAKAMMISFLSMPPTSAHSLNNSVWIQINFGITIAARIDILTASNLDIREDTSHLRRFLDVTDLLQQSALRLESLSWHVTDEVGERNVFYQFLDRIRHMQAWHASQKLQSSLVSTSSSTSGSTGRMPQEISTLQPMNCSTAPVSAKDMVGDSFFGSGLMPALGMPDDFSFDFRSDPFLQSFMDHDQASTDISYTFLDSSV